MHYFQTPRCFSADLKGKNNMRENGACSQGVSEKLALSSSQMVILHRSTKTIKKMLFQLRMQVNFGAWHFCEISAYNKPASKIFIVQAKGYKKVLPSGKKVRDLAGLRPKYTRLCRNCIVKYLPPIGGDGRGPKGRGQAIVVITDNIPRLSLIYNG